MTQNRLLYLLQFMLRECWKFFRLPFPGTNVSIGAIMFLPMVVSLAVATIRHLFGIGGFGNVGSTANSHRNATARGVKARKAEKGQ